jgi:hypothetical protein
VLGAARSSPRRPALLGCAEGWWPVRECGLINVGGPFVLLGDLRGPQVLISRCAARWCGLLRDVTGWAGGRDLVRDAG